MEPDFSGYATKANLVCSDGRTIMPEAFQHMDGQQVPLVWQHGHNDINNLLGHAKLEARTDGVYAYAFFNNSQPGQLGKEAVVHGDVDSLSIYANKLIERGKQVFHGVIKEVSLVLSGANPGARIDNVRIAHSEDYVETLEDEVFIRCGEVLVHGADGEPVKGKVQDPNSVEHAEDGSETVRDVYNTMSQKQQDVVDYMVGVAYEEGKADAGSAQHSDIEEGAEDENSEDNESEEDNSEDNESDENSEDNEDNESDENSEDTGSEDDNSSAEHSAITQEGNDNMTRSNVFEDVNGGADQKPTLTHDQLTTIVKTGKKLGSFKEAVLAHADEYGITDINMLFPDAKSVTQSPEFIARRMEWVATVLDGTKHLPFAKVKSVFADITEAEARAKGYLKGTRKKEEVFSLLKRTTGPTTVYKKQKLDRDDVLDITEFDVINWLKAEMRLMIEEELARAILVGDGRSAMDEDKVKDPEGAPSGDGIRSILHDDPLYAIKKELPSNVTPKDAVKAIIRAANEYRGTGTPVMYTSRAQLTELLLDEDRYGRPLYPTKQALADKLGVSNIIPVDIFPEYEGLFAIIVSLTDYSIGTNRGGELTSFEDFDIDFNQHKYLQETRLSGGLTKPYSAIVIMQATGTDVTPTAPSFDGTTNTITIPTVAGVDYTIDGEVVTGDVVIDEPTEVLAEAEDGYYIPLDKTREWTYAP